MPLFLRLLTALLAGVVAWWVWYIVGTLTVWIATPFVSLFASYTIFKETNHELHDSRQPLAEER